MPYGSSCGLELTGSDTVVAGVHQLEFATSGALPNSPVAFLIGGQKIEVQLPGFPCPLRTVPVAAPLMLADASGFVRRQLGRVLHTRRVPELAWYYDDSQEFQEEMEQKIQAALDRDLVVNPGAHTGDVPSPEKDKGNEQEGEQSLETREDGESLS